MEEVKVHSFDTTKKTEEMNNEQFVFEYLSKKLWVNPDKD